MKRLCSVVMLFVLTLAAQCIVNEKSDNGKDENFNDDSMDIDSYYPSPLSNSIYTWHTKRISNDSSVVDTTYCQTIAGPYIDDGQKYYTITGDDSLEPMSFRFERNALYVRVERNFFEGLVIGTEDGTQFGYYYTFFDFSAPRNMNYTVLSGGTKTDDVYVNFDISVMFLGFDTISTALGDFDDCPSFKLVITVRYTPRVSGTTHSFDRVEKWWFGKNTGPVKRSIEKYVDTTLQEQIDEELIEMINPERQP